jgi:hypothetical protein
MLTQMVRSASLTRKKVRVQEERNRVGKKCQTWRVNLLTKPLMTSLRINRLCWKSNRNHFKKGKKEMRRMMKTSLQIMDLNKVVNRLNLLKDLDSKISLLKLINRKMSKKNSRKMHRKQLISFLFHKMRPQTLKKWKWSGRIHKMALQKIWLQISINHLNGDGLEKWGRIRTPKVMKKYQVLKVDSKGIPSVKKTKKLDEQIKRKRRNFKVNQKNCHNHIKNNF